MLNHSGDIIISARNKKLGKDCVFRCKTVIVASGGKPTIPKQVYDHFPIERSKIIMGDNFLRSSVYKEEMEKLRKLENPKVVIIGGSHSGFSAAHVLTHGPNVFNHNKGYGKRKLELEEFPKSKLKKCLVKSHCCTCGKGVKGEECPCPCDCYGYFDTSSDCWGYDKETEIPDFGVSDVKILY